MSEHFDSDWLSLREPADHQARADALVDALNAFCPTQRPCQIVDLGAGSGSNLRYIAPRLNARQHWHCIDHDAALLVEARARAPASVQVSGDLVDLRDFVKAPFKADILTASALLDLVSGDWIDALAAGCAAAQAPALLALSVNGQIRLAPELPDDHALIAAVNAHQQGPKDMGCALGPAAVHYAANAFRRHGYSVQTQPSDWCLSAAQADLQNALMQGWVEAACAHEPAQKTRWQRWQAARREQLGNLVITVGHDDLLALPCPD